MLGCCECDLVRCWDRLDVVNGVGMLRMGCEGESEGKREVKQKKKKKKGLKVISIRALVRNSNSLLLTTISDENFVANSVLINTFSDKIFRCKKPKLLEFRLAPKFFAWRLSSY